MPSSELESRARTNKFDSGRKIFFVAFQQRIDTIVPRKAFERNDPALPRGESDGAPSLQRLAPRRRATATTVSGTTTSLGNGNLKHILAAALDSLC